MNKHLLTAFFLLVTFCSCYTQINTGVVYLDQEEQLRFKMLIDESTEVALIYDSIKTLAISHLSSNPKPIKNIHYEGLLDNDINRIETVQCLLDANKIVDLIYAGYGSDSIEYGMKIKEIVLAWVHTYTPTGNPINENKLTPFFWGYTIYKNIFNTSEKQSVESWMLSIALKELEREHTPNNNWQAKRLKIIGIIGCIIDDAQLKQFSSEGIKSYISSAYYPDGTSNDLKSRDALHYHVSGIEPLLDMFINLQKFDSRFDLYFYNDSLGTSIKKAIEYTIPYISGEKTHKEWVNTKVDLDKERAAAGLEKYQPGILFDPDDAISMLNWAAYYNPDLFKFVCGCNTCFTCNIEALLNSPAVRE